MGFTPLEGVMMARRSGSVDPGLMLYLLGKDRLSLGELDHGLNDRAGLLGVSGVSADMRAVLAAVQAGNERARLAVAIFVRRVLTSVGAMTAVLGGLDALVCTGGIGEHSAPIRAQLAAGLGYLGLRLDESANAAPTRDADVAAHDSAIRLLVIAAREDLAILREVRSVLELTGAG
jgi:acetate kinase